MRVTGFICTGKGVRREEKTYLFSKNIKLFFSFLLKRREEDDCVIFHAVIWVFLPEFYKWGSGDIS